MTITAQTARSGPYNGNGSTTVFDYAFRVDDEADLVVTLRSAAGTETVQTLTTHYTVAGVGEASGGTITMVTAPATGEQLVITRSVGLTQEVDLQNRGAVDPETLEQAYDKLTQIAQDQQQQIDRAVKTDLFDATSTDELIANINAVAAVDGEIADIAAAVEAALAGALLPANNLSELTDVETALQNLNYPDQLSRLPIKADAAIAKGAVVYATGAVGSSGRLTVDNYIADGSITEVYIIGIADRALATNAEGYAIAFGELRNVSTDGSTAFGSETWTAGTVLYADPNNAGYLTNVEPTYPDVVTPVAMVLVAHASNGILFARPNIDEDMPTLSQATWETGTDTTESLVTPAKIKAAIGAHAGWSYYNGTDGVIYDGAVDGTVASVESPVFEDGYEYKFLLLQMTTADPPDDFQFRLYWDQDAAWDAWGDVLTGVSEGAVTLSTPRMGVGVTDLISSDGLARLITATDRTSKVDKVEIRHEYTTGVGGNITGGKIIMLRRPVGV